MARILKSSAAIALLASAIALSATASNAANTHNGGQIFASDCAMCHTSGEHAPSTVGPNLFGVVGRHAGTLPGYSYSPAMKHSGVTWTPEELKLYIADPRKGVPGNKMPFGGLHDPSKVDDLVAYLQTLH